MRSIREKLIRLLNRALAGILILGLLSSIGLAASAQPRDAARGQMSVLAAPLKLKEPKCSGFGIWLDCSARNQWRQIGRISDKGKLVDAYRQWVSPVVTNCYRNFEKSIGAKKPNSCKALLNAGHLAYLSQILTPNASSVNNYDLVCARENLQQFIQESKIKSGALSGAMKAVVAVKLTEKALGQGAMLFPPAVMAGSLKFSHSNVDEALLKIGEVALEYSLYSGLISRLYACPLG